MPPRPPKLFQHTAARRRLLSVSVSRISRAAFQHTAARRRLRLWRNERTPYLVVSTHSRPKAAAGRRFPVIRHSAVSTHSRPKAAALRIGSCVWFFKVSTHSRPKAAAAGDGVDQKICQSFNTQPPEGGCLRLNRRQGSLQVSTHSRPKAAASGGFLLPPPVFPFQHTAARRRLPGFPPPITSAWTFQHTAARRRLQPPCKRRKIWQAFQHTAARRRLPRAIQQFCAAIIVSTHSRPKAAAWMHVTCEQVGQVSTHSRPKAAAPCLKTL